MFLANHITTMELGITIILMAELDTTIYVDKGGVCTI
jgi:hypothetical protein